MDYLVKARLHDGMSHGTSHGISYGTLRKVRHLHKRLHGLYVGLTE
jgi:hypothetical protein